MELVRIIAPPATRDQVRRAGPARVPDAGEVDIQHGAPGIFVQVDRHAPRGDSGGRAHHVESAESLDTAIGGGRDTRKVTHIDDLGVYPRAGLSDQRRRLVKVGRSAVRDHHRFDRTAHVQRDDVGALLREPHGLRAPDPPRRAGDQGDFSGEPPGHVVFCVKPASTTSCVPVM